MSHLRLNSRYGRGLHLASENLPKRQKSTTRSVSSPGQHADGPPAQESGERMNERWHHSLGNEETQPYLIEDRLKVRPCSTEKPGRPAGVLRKLTKPERQETLSTRERGTLADFDSSAGPCPSCTARLFLRGAVEIYRLFAVHRVAVDPQERRLSCEGQGLHRASKGCRCSDRNACMAAPRALPAAAVIVSEAQR